MRNRPRVLNSEDLRKRSLEQLNAIPLPEREAWLNHPLTIALKLGLEADIEEIKEGWANGNYRGDLENYKQVGMVQATDSVAEWVAGVVEYDENND